MAIYAVFRALGLRIEILPVLGLPDRIKRGQLKFGGVNPNPDYSGRRLSFLKRLERQSKHRLWYGRGDGDMAPEPTIDDIWPGYDCYDEVNGERNPEVTDLGNYKDVQTRLQTILRTRQISGVSTAPDPVIAGTKLHKRVEIKDLDIGDSEVDVLSP